MSRLIFPSRAVHAAAFGLTVLAAGLSAAATLANTVPTTASPHDPPPLRVEVTPRPAAETSPAPTGPVVSVIPALAGTNLPPPVIPPGFDSMVVTDLQQRLGAARQLRLNRQASAATPMLVELLGEKSPEFIQKGALLELAAGAEDERDLARAQTIYGQYGQRWGDDPCVPEILLRQGQVFRQMGLNTMALAKFYAVMTSALVLKHDQFDYYSRLVTQAQTEIADTHFALEKYPEAAEYLTRLLKQASPLINRPEAQFKLIRCLAQGNRPEDTIAQAQDFLTRYPAAAAQAEVRFHLALALKQAGRSNESLTQVLALLREQNALARTRPDTWTYWQQRTGNLIANQLYREGDYPRALDIYLSLAQLDRSPAWQLPVWYQIGMTYERLWQPHKAVETYQQILGREKELSATAAPGLRAVVDMARWRAGFVQWQNRAEGINQSFHATNTPALAGLGAPPLAAP